MSNVMDDRLALALDSALETVETHGDKLVLAPEREVTQFAAVGAYALRGEQSVDAQGRPLLVCDGMLSRHGWTLLGPETCHPRIDDVQDILTHSQAVFWAYTPPLVVWKDKVIRKRPSIVVTGKDRHVCRACGHAENMWHDERVRSSMYGKLPLKCTACGSDNTTFASLCTTVTTSLARSAPVVEPEAVELGAKLRDRLSALLEQRDNAQVTFKPLQMPRVWAVYDLHKVPDTVWTPEDEVADELRHRSRAQRFDVLPYSIAARYHEGPVPISKGLRTFWLEAPRLATGWITGSQLAELAELAPKVHGYRREFWASR